MARNQARKPSQLTADEVLQQILSWQETDYAEFIHPVTDLSFDYPKHFTQFIDVYPEGDIVVFQDTELGMGIQLFTQVYDDTAESITPERINRDLPDLVIKSPALIDIGEGTRALKFESSDPDLGPTREFWIVLDGHLHQLTVYAPEPRLDAYFSGLVHKIVFRL